MSIAARKGADGWTEQWVGACLIRHWQGNATIVEGASLVGTDIRVDALCVDCVPGMAVWVRHVDGPLWRRGRLIVTSETVEFHDEAAATEGDRSDLPAPTATMMFKAALLASAIIRARSAASEVYADLLFVALTSATWEAGVSHRASLGDRDADDIIATLTGRGYSWVAAHLTIGELIDARVLDQEIVGDIAGLGWRPRL
jgi:hypothetical protein